MAITKINTPELFDLGATNSSLQLPSGNTASRPSNPSTGEWRYNTDDNKVEYWDGSAWFQIDYEASAVTPTSNFQTVTYTGNGSTQTIDSKFDMAADFNGSSSKIVPATDPIPSTGAFTVSAWVRTSTSNSCFISFGDFWLKSEYLSGVFSLGDPNPSLQGTTDISDGNWHHCVVTVDASNNIVLYVDGGSEDTGTSTISRTNGGSFTIGVARNSSPVYYWNGNVDQVRIFNTALNLTQVGELYNDETDSTASVLNFPTGAGCIAAYQFNGNPADVGGTYGGVATDIGYTGLEFEPDFVWIKQRNGSASHSLQDTVRGAGQNYNLYSDNTAYEGQYGIYGYLSSFDTNGFTVEVASGNHTNGNGNSYAAWCWKAGGPAVLNQQGDINSQVSANQDAGFSIVKFTGGNASGTTVGHGLSQPIELLIVKNLNDGSDNWVVWHKDVEQNSTSSSTFTLKGGSALFLNLNLGSYSYSYDGQMGATSSENLIAYCFHSVDGYQKVGSYTGNGSTTGPIVETGFEPAFVLVKCTNLSTAGSYWSIFDNRRNPVNPRDIVLRPNSSSGDWTADDNEIDFLSNGFQLKGTYDATNGNGNTYIYLAIAANPKPAPVLANSFDISLYTGNGGTQNVYSSLSPDLVWVKSRSNSTSHVLSDSVRGANLKLRSNSTAAEAGTDYGVVTSFDTNGFTVGGTIDTGDVSYLNWTYVAWQWKAAGIPTINTDGTITSLVNANPNAGFSIVKYSGSDGTKTVGHGLSSALEMIIIKSTTSSAAWRVYHTSVGNTKALELNGNSEEFSFANWNNTSPTSSLFTVKGSSVDGTWVNGTGNNYIAYCFHSVDGYQKVGTYSSTGATGINNQITTGFRPRFLLVKSYSNPEDWYIFDSERINLSGSNDGLLFANTSASENTGFARLEFTDTGWYWETAYGGNSSGYDYIYLAIA